MTACIITRTGCRRPNTSARLLFGNRLTVRPCGGPSAAARCRRCPPTIAASLPSRSWRAATISPLFPAASPAWRPAASWSTPSAWPRRRSAWAPCAACWQRTPPSCMACSRAKAYWPPAPTPISWSTTPTPTTSSAPRTWWARRTTTPTRAWSPRAPSARCGSAASPRCPPAKVLAGPDGKYLPRGKCQL